MLQRFRLRAGLTQEDLAERAGLSPDAIGLLERGARRRPQRHTVRALATALALPDDDRANFETAARGPISPAGGSTRLDSSLPMPATSLVGRDDALADVIRLLDHPEVRLLTLTGPGGVGKTRLALAVAARLSGSFPNGVAFVPLAHLRDPELLASALARTLAVTERAGQTPLDAVTARLGEQRMLLVLDNLEHLPAADPLVAELMAACPQLVVLATSRAPLHLRGEQQFPVQPLAQSAAVTLFTQRARAAMPAFALTAEYAAAVAEICRRLDGLPLAIELGAAWIKTLPPSALLERLDHALPLLADGPRDAPERHRTLRSAIAWSCDLLTPAERTLLGRLSIFSGGWTLAAAEAVTDAALNELAGLIDASLVQPPITESTGEPRYTMLETIREYAAELLVAGCEEREIRHRHATYMLQLLERTGRELVGPHEAAALARLEEEQANLRAALGWVLDQREADMAVRFAAVIWRFWAARSHLSEGRSWLEAILRLARECLASDDAIPADGITPLRIAMLLHVTANLVRVQGDYAQADALYTECLAIRRERDDQDGIIGALHNLGIIAFQQGDYQRAIDHFQEALPIARANGNTYGTAFGLASYGEAVTALGDLDRAKALYTESLALFQSIEHSWGIALALAGLAEVSTRQGDPGNAAALYRESLALSGRLGDRLTVATGLERLARLELLEGSTAGHAARLLGAAAALREQINAPLPPASQSDHERSLAEARRQLGEAAFTASWDTGRRLTLDEAVAAALAAET
jgi:predicted ATPase/DNA-binding XRE family transcriptional regulator